MIVACVKHDFVVVYDSGISHGYPRCPVCVTEEILGYIKVLMEKDFKEYDDVEVAIAVRRILSGEERP